MRAAKDQPTPEPVVDPLLLATADLREAAASLRELVAQADAVSGRLAATVDAATALMGQIAEYQRAQRLLLDVPALVSAAANGSTDA